MLANQIKPERNATVPIDNTNESSLPLEGPVIPVPTFQDFQTDLAMVLSEGIR